MNSTNLDPAKSSSTDGQPQEEAKVAKKLSEQVSKGLSQPPSRSQVPPATASEELVQ